MWMISSSGINTDIPPMQLIVSCGHKIIRIRCIKQECAVNQANEKLKNRNFADYIKF